MVVADLVRSDSYSYQRLYRVSNNPVRIRNEVAVRDRTDRYRSNTLYNAGIGRRLDFAA